MSGACVKRFFKLMVQCVGVFCKYKRAVFLWYNSGYFYRITNAKNGALIESKTRSLFLWNKAIKTYNLNFL
ncbi:hypothetical protein HMPREF1395_00167 [Helicobacter pylori GAM112Ai]|nr:hypothetical protein HMPREF1395_00167 [Helicobacter pylori GAM112Ai]EMH33260.1 hypothetical protein HMPREF1424_00746 [Helicobacter pylori GAM42Ai]